MKKIFLFIFLWSIATQANDWGQTGHRATAEIADKYLKKRVKRKIKKLLQGESLAFVSTFGDEIKSDKKYKKYYPWHYVNMPLDATYEKVIKNPEGDLITGIEHCIKILKDDKSSDNEKRFWLKMLIHFIGDLHQPLHVGLKEDWGGNKIQVQWHKRGSNLHRVWDEDLIDKLNMSYTEFAKNEKRLTKFQIRQIKKGSVIDWLNDTHKLTKKVYKSAKKGDNLSYKYSYDWTPTIHKQLQKGGIRLAKILNNIFD